MRIAVLSLHTSPTAQPGQGDAGGMNVYVARTVRVLAEAGHLVDVFTADPSVVTEDLMSLQGPMALPGVSDSSGSTRGRGGFGALHGSRGGESVGDCPGTGASTACKPRIRLHQLSSSATTKEELAEDIDALSAQLADHPAFRASDLVWAHYWISAAAGLRALEEAGPTRPRFVISLHTIGAVKNRDSATAHEPELRLRTEAKIASAADVLVANTAAERDDLIAELGARPEKVVIAQPGVDHTIFRPGSRIAARQRIGLADADLIVLTVGRMQFIKGSDLLPEVVSELSSIAAGLSARVRVIMLGAASGQAAEASGYQAELEARIAADPAIVTRLPVPASVLADYYRAADVLLVPSRSESFGLVAAEAAATGLPVLAAEVGGLPDIVDPERTGRLIAGRDPADWARSLADLLADDRLREEMAGHAVTRAVSFDWALTCARVVGASVAPDDTADDSPRALVCSSAQVAADDSVKECA